MPDVRAFIAINLPQDIVRRLTHQIELISDLVPRGVVRWVREDNIHLTLKFLGEIPSNEIDEISRLMKQLAARHVPFQFEVTSFGCFPNLKSPRILWIDIREPGSALLRLHSDLEDELHVLGFSHEQRRFHPHLTIGRVKRNLHRSEMLDLAKSLAEVKVGQIGFVHVDKFELMRSDLRPTGAVYSQLCVATLKEAT